MQITPAQLWQRGLLLRYVSAVLAVVLALIFRLALNPVLGFERFPYATLFGAMVFCAWYCGIGPSIVALALSLGSVLFLFSKPHFTFRLEDPVQQIGGMLLFTLVSAFIVALGESGGRVLEGEAGPVAGDRRHQLELRREGAQRFRI